MTLSYEMATRQQAAQGGHMRPEIKRDARRYEGLYSPYAPVKIRLRPGLPYAHIGPPGWHDFPTSPQNSHEESHSEMRCTLSLAGHKPQCQGNTNTQEPGYVDLLPNEEIRTPRMYMMNDNELPQKHVTWGDRLNHGLGLGKVRAPTPLHVPSTPQRTMSLSSLQSSVPVFADYELWRFEKDGAEWTSAIRRQCPGSQKDLAKKARTRSKNGATCDQIQKMGPNRRQQVEQLVQEKFRETGLRWEPAWMEEVKASISRNNKKDVRIFDVIIARAGVAGARTGLIYPSRLSPLGQHFVKLSNTNYEACSQFLLLNPATIDEDHLQYLTEARLALDRGDVESARSCVGKSMYVRDCKDSSTWNYFDTLMRSQEKRRAFNNDLETALTLLKRPSRQDIDRNHHSGGGFEITKPYRKTLSHENESILIISEDLAEVRADVRWKRQELESVRAMGRHQDRELRREKSRIEVVRVERDREEARLRREERKRDEAKEKRLRLAQENRQSCVYFEAGSPTPGHGMHLRDDAISLIAPEGRGFRKIQSALRLDCDRFSQHTEKPNLQTSEAEKFGLSEQISHQEGTSESVNINHTTLPDVRNSRGQKMIQICRKAFP